LKDGGGLALLKWPSRKVKVPNLVKDYTIKIEATIEGGLTLLSSLKTIKV